MKIFNSILKFILILVICILLILFQLFFIVFLLSTIQELIVSDRNYLLLTNNSLYKYIIFFVIVTTFLILIFLHKKGLLKLNEDLLYLEKLLFNKIFIISFSVISLLIFTITVFNFDAVYKDRIVTYSIFHSKVTRKYEDIKEVDVKIKKYWNGSMNANYILVFDNHNVDVLGSIINVKDEADSYDHNILIDNKIKELGITKKVNDKYLSDYNKSLDRRYAEKMNKLFDK